MIANDALAAPASDPDSIVDDPTDGQPQEPSSEATPTEDPVEPAPTSEPAPSEPAPSEPAPSEPAPSEPAPSEPSGDAPTEGPEPADPGPETEPVEEPEPTPDAPIRPPRFDGPYVGALLMGVANFAHVLNHSTPAPLIGTGGFAQAGDAVFPWMSIGVAVGGQAAWTGRQQMFGGALLVEFGWVPARRYPLSIRTGFGFGGGALREQGIEGRSGFGGALFKGSLRYEFFPLAEKKRPDRGGGWAIGPELGWLGATPSGKDQPFVNTVLLGLSTSFYFGS